MTCSHDDSSWCTDECTRPVTATEIAQRTERYNTLFARNLSNRERWTFLYVWMRACSMLGQFPDIRDQATIDRYNDMMARRLLSVRTIGGYTFFVRALELARLGVRNAYDAYVTQVNEQLAAGACLGIGDAPGTARVVRE